MSKRADILLVEREMVESRAKAQAEITAGHVLSDGKRVRKSSQKISETAELILRSKIHSWVSRAGQKLDFALSHFELLLEARTVLDVGASTDGFAQVALQAGAQRVLAVDVGRKNIARGGIVKDPELHAKVCQDIGAWLNGQDGWYVTGSCPSPIEDGDGNKEFLIVASKSK